MVGRLCSQHTALDIKTRNVEMNKLRTDETTTRCMFGDPPDPATSPTVPILKVHASSRNKRLIHVHLVFVEFENMITEKIGNKMFRSRKIFTTALGSLLYLS